MVMDNQNVVRIVEFGSKKQHFQALIILRCVTGTVYAYTWSAFLVA